MHNVQWFTLKFLTHYERSGFRLWFPFLWSTCPCLFILVLHFQHQSIHKYSNQEWTFSSHDPTTVKMTLLKEEDPIPFLSNFSLSYQSPKFQCENYCYLNKREMKSIKRVRFYSRLKKNPRNIPNEFQTHSTRLMIYIRISYKTLKLWSFLFQLVEILLFAGDAVSHPTIRNPRYEGSLKKY